MIRRLGPSGAELDRDDLVAAYAIGDRTKPHLRMNFVTSLDGAVSVGGVSKGLSTPDDQRVFRILRLLSDVVLVGAGTLRIEDYNPLELRPEDRAWRHSQGLPEIPLLAVVSGRLDLRPDLRALERAPVRPLILTLPSAAADRRAELAQVADVVDVVDVREAMGVLHDRGFRQVLCEGGPTLMGALTVADLVDELCLSVAPVLVGPGPGRITAGLEASAVRSMRLEQVLQSDDGTLLLRYRRTS